MQVPQKVQHLLRLLTALAVLASMVLNPIATVTAAATTVGWAQPQQVDVPPVDPPSGRDALDEASVELMTPKFVDKTPDTDKVSAADAQQISTYIVVLAGDALATYTGGVNGLPATSPRVTGRDKLNARSPESQAYLQYLEQQQANFIARANRTVGRDLEVLYYYKATLNGFAARMTAAEAAALAKMDGVRFVEKERIYELLADAQPNTDAGPGWIGAPEIWGGDSTALAFSAALSGANEVPAVQTTASGVATLSYNLHTMELQYEISIADIDNVTASHIHRGAAGANGGVAYGLFSSGGGGVFGPGNPISGTVTLSEADQALLMNQGLYINVHTTDFPSGEIRGQIVLSGTLGAGIIVGVIDTGIDPWNPSFAATGGDGYAHVNPFGDGNYRGVCDPANTTPAAGVVAYDSTFPCNAKLIGVWGYTASDASPRDKDGHGSHTASTAAGNIVKNSVVKAPTGSFTMTMISGVAPHANIIAYDGCIDGGGCPGASLQAARDQALLDGVDVINYSIGSNSPTPDPFNEAEALSWLALRDAGIFVATSNGNAGPGDATTGSPSDLPWITSIGANSHNRAFISTVTLTGGSQPLDIVGMALSTGYGPAPLVFAKDFVIPPTTAENARLCAPNAFPAGTFNGQIVVCDRGIYGRVDKGASAAAGGAGGFILAQPDEVGGGPGSITADTHVIPASHIDYFEYQKLLAYVAGAGGPVTAEISGGVLTTDPAYADIMAAFSSRGPNRGTFVDMIVPKVTAPGRSIWAAYNQGPGGDGDFTFNVIQGTSMSSPHVAGAGALMKALHPSWSPAEIESALMSTARTNTLNDDGINIATPFAQGSGQVDLGKAARAGLVLDVTKNDYLAANPKEGGDPKALNLASMANSRCLVNCSWTRTVKSSLAVTETWTVSTTADAGVTISVQPAQFTIAPGATQEIVVTANASGAPLGKWLFGQVMLTPSGNAPTAHFPVALVSTTGLLPASVEIETRRDAGSQVIADLRTIAASNLTIQTYGLTSGDVVEFSLSKDPTNGNAYDNLNDGTTIFYTVTVPAGALLLAANIVDSESPDLDLFVGTGSTPSEATQVCSSATASAAESCEIKFPAAGEWWILVQNWEASNAAPDDSTMAIAVVAGNAGNMQVTGPNSIAAEQPFDLRVSWNESALDAGETWYGGFTIGTDPANPGNIGTILVTLLRRADDVAKFVSTDVAAPGEVVTYTIVVDTNVMPDNLTYTLNDSIPNGMSYVEGSASASHGNVSVIGNQIGWTGVMTGTDNAVGSYQITTNQQDPLCRPPVGPGGYVDAQTLYGFPTSPGISGDTFSFSFNSHAGTDFYGTERLGSPLFTDDGIVVFGQYAGQPWVNQQLPNLAAPKGLYAPYWRDMEIVYDAAANRGVTAVTYGGGIFWLVEFDDIQPYGVPTTTLDIGVMAWNDLDPTVGSYDVYFAYDNVTITDTIGTIGVENDAGDAATQFSYNNFTPTNGLVICLDYVGPAPAVITFSAKVNENVTADSITNVVAHNTDNPGSQPASASVSLDVGYTIDVSADPADGGTVSGSGDYDIGAMVAVTATANTGYMFTNWTENDMPVSSQAVYTFTATANRNLVANFAQPTSLSLSVAPTTTVPVGQPATLMATVEITPSVPAVDQGVSFTDGRFTATLSGANEAPVPVTTTATGEAIFLLNPDTGVVSYTLDFTGITSPTMAHVHQGAVGTNGPVQFWLWDPSGVNATSDLPATGVFTPTVGQLSQWLQGNMYVNVHSAAYPGGEIRGQIGGAANAFTDASGQASTVITSPTPMQKTMYALTWAGLMDSAEIAFVQATAMSVTAHAAEIMFGEAVTLTAHVTGSHGGPMVGETVMATDGILLAQLSGANEVPANNSTATGMAHFVANPASYNAISNTLKVSYTLTVEGLQNITGAHVHYGGPSVNGGVAYPLQVGAGSFDMRATDLVALLTGNLYVNVHTQSFPGGEIRGQILGAAMGVTDENGMATLSFTPHYDGMVTIYVAPLTNPLSMLRMAMVMVEAASMNLYLPVIGR